MKRFIIAGFVAAFMIYSNPLPAQGEATMLFLLIPPSPLLNGMGQVGAALPTNEAYGFYYNPAQLGYTGQTVNAALQFYPSKTDWLPAFNFSDLTYNSFALNLGYNFRDRSPIIPLSVSLGYMKGEINYGRNTLTDDQGNIIAVFDSKESYSAYGIGVGMEYFVNLSLGLTYKTINSQLVPIQVGTWPIGGEAETDAIDYGALLTAPVLKPFEKHFLKESESKFSIIPYCDVSLGYAKTNIGDKVSYLDPSQKDPIPRTAKLGYALSTGADFRMRDISIRALGIDWSVDASDRLVTDDGNYQGGLLGDISFGGNLLSAKSDDEVEIHKGLRLQFFDFLAITSGRFYGPGWENVKTSGYSLGAKGILKALAASSSDRTFRYLADHFDLQYACSEIDSGPEHPLTGTTYQSILLTVGGFW